MAGGAARRRSPLRAAERDALDAREVAHTVEVDEPGVGEKLAHRLRLVISMLDGEKAAVDETRARAGDDRAQRVETVDARRERGDRLVAHVALRKMRVAGADVRRIADDRVE